MRATIVLLSLTLAASVWAVLLERRRARLSVTRLDAYRLIAPPTRRSS